MTVSGGNRRHARAVLLALLLGLTAHPRAYGGEGRVLFIFDASTSMLANGASGKTRIEEARSALAGVVPQFAARVGSLGLVAFGHKPRPCDIETVVKLGPPGVSNAITRQVKSIWPRGNTPLADSIGKAGAELGRSGGNGQGDQIIVLTDGFETCGGDPAGTAAKLRQQYPGLKIHVIGFATGTDASNRLRAIAVAGGGSIQVTSSESGLGQALTNIMEGGYIPDAAPLPDSAKGRPPILNPETIPSELDFADSPERRPPDLSRLEAEIAPEPPPELPKAAPKAREPGSEKPDDEVPGKVPPESEVSQIPLM